MPFQLQDTAGLLSDLTALCFSFCISVQAFWFKKSDELPKLLGRSFIPVFLLSAASLLVNTGEMALALKRTAEPLLLLLFSIMLLSGMGKKRAIPHAIILVLLPLALLLAEISSPAIRDFLSLELIYLFISTAISITALFMLLRKSAGMDGFFHPILILLLSNFAQYYFNSGILSLLTPLLKISAYLLFLHCFYRFFLKSLLARSDENEKKLNEISRSVENEVKKRMLEVEKINKNLINMSRTDALSQVLNKAAILEAIENMISGKSKSEFSILMFDIDNFKGINDTYGHIVGDKCIKALSAASRGNIRDIDLIGRYGGDEFLIVLPGTAAKQAIFVAERFRKRVEASVSPHYTISIGVASYPSDGSDAKTLIGAADEGLYMSKQKGRNSVSHRNFY